MPARDSAWLRDAITRAGDALGLCGEVDVGILGDAAMAAAHQRFAGVGGTTDVLTFDHGVSPAEPSGSRVVELLVCLDEAERQAQRRGHPTQRELLLYAVHGLLHCTGHDDRDEAAAARMHEEEDRILRRIGVGPVYAAAGAEGGAS